MHYGHHFDDACSHEILAPFVGPGVPRGVVVARTVQQVDIVPTLAAHPGLTLDHARGAPLPEVAACGAGRAGGGALRSRRLRR